MNTQHTPGPWSSSGTAGHETHGQYAVYHEGTGKDIAIVYDGKAHAHLIAAAPDGYHILSALADWLNESGGAMPKGSSLMPDSETKTFAGAIHAYLMKARGL